MEKENIFNQIQRIIQIQCNSSDCESHTFLHNETIHTLLTYCKETDKIQIKYICEKGLNTQQITNTLRFKVEYEEEGKNQIDFTRYKCSLNSLHQCGRAFTRFCKKCNQLFCNLCKTGHEEHKNQSYEIEQYNDDQTYSEPKDLQETFQNFKGELESIQKFQEDQKITIQEQCRSQEPQLRFPETQKNIYIESQDQNIFDLRAEINKNKAYLKLIQEAESKIESYRKQKDNLNDSDVLKGNQNNVFNIVENNNSLIDQINNNKINPGNIILPKNTLHIDYKQILDDLKKDKYVKNQTIQMMQQNLN